MSVELIDGEMGDFPTSFATSRGDTVTFLSCLCLSRDAHRIYILFKPNQLSKSHLAKSKVESRNRKC